MKKSPRYPSSEVDMLALNAARVLGKFGSANPDWTEWRCLKDSLLKAMPLMSKEVKDIVGGECSDFNQCLSREIK